MFLSKIGKFNIGKLSIELLCCGIFNLILYLFHDKQITSHVFPHYLLFLSLLIINWTFRFMYRCICGRTFCVTVCVTFVIMYELQIILN